MITPEDYFAQLPKERKQGFSDLNVAYHLRKPILIKLQVIHALTCLFLVPGSKTIQSCFRTWYLILVSVTSLSAVFHFTILRLNKLSIKSLVFKIQTYTFFALTIKNDGRRNSLLRLGKLHTASFVGIGSIIFSICKPLSIRVFRIVDIVR